MPVPNIFKSDLFSMTSLTGAINNLPFKPSLIGSLGLFEEDGISTLDAWIEEQDGVLSLLDVVPRNAPGKTVDDKPRNGYSFRIPHIPEQGGIMADEVQGVRAFGSETMAETLQSRRDRRLQIMRNSMEYTIESHRLLAIKGLYKNANNADESLFTKFGVTQQTTAMALGTATTKVRTKCLDVHKQIEDALGGLSATGVTVLCSDTFYGKLVDHELVRDTLLSTPMSAELRSDPRLAVNFGGMQFVRYRGTAAVKIADNEAFAIPTGVQGLFLTRYAPANYMETVNTIGIPFYVKANLMKFDKGVELEAQSNPLNICTRPAAVIKLTTN